MVIQWGALVVDIMAKVVGAYGGGELLLERGHLLEETRYSPKWWWLVVDIYPSHEAAKSSHIHFGKWNVILVYIKTVR